MSAQELIDKYNEDLKNLQETCQHENISDWAMEYWAPAHSTGRQVKYCINCWKNVEVKESPALQFIEIQTANFTEEE